MNESSIKMLKHIEGHFVTLVTERKKQIEEDDQEREHAEKEGLPVLDASYFRFMEKQKGPKGIMGHMKLMH